MIIKQIKIQNFRCFIDKSIEFSPKYTILIGENAVGKTSIIEAVNVLSVCKSFRTLDYRDLINESSDYFVIEGLVLSGEKTDSLSFYGDDRFKKVKINKFNLNKMSDYVGTFNVVCFSALDFLLVKSNAVDRRKMFDLVFCQISKDYLYVSNYYKKLLKERNALLKSLIFENSDSLEVLLETVTEQLVFYGKKIIEYRKAFCKKISEFAEKIHFRITEKHELLTLEYKACVEVDFETKIKEATKEDLKRGYSTIGPHRDDYVFFVNNKNVMVYGSQGQQKNSILSVKLAMAEFINEIKKEAPTLLLDDVFSELDKNRQNALVRNLNPDFQTIITTASVSDLDKSILENSLVINLEKRSV